MAVVVILVLHLILAAVALAGGTVHKACFEQLEDGRPFVMAYRGASAEFPEHTMGAYRKAIHQGAQFIECDVVLTRDLVPICRHEPNIAETTNVFSVFPQAKQKSGSGTQGEPMSVTASTAPAVLASDLTWADIQQLTAVFPGDANAVPANARAGAVETAATRSGDAAVSGHLHGHLPAQLQCCERQDGPGQCASPDVAGQCPAVDDTSGPTAQFKASPTELGARVETAAGAPEESQSKAVSELRVASLEDLLRMASAALPAVGVAVHIQSASWHNSLPQVLAANTTFEDILLELLQRYGYATGPYGSEAWRQQPSYLMAFEAGSLKYLSSRTSSPLTQVLGPTIPDTGEDWNSATSAEGLARIATYASSVAVARQQLLGPAHDGGDGLKTTAPLEAVEPLHRMRKAGLQVFASVFKPRPASHLLPGATRWEDEVAPLLLGSAHPLLPEGRPAAKGGGATELWPGDGRGSAIDGLFTDSPGELHFVLEGFRCGSTVGAEDVVELA